MISQHLRENPDIDIINSILKIPDTEATLLISFLKYTFKILKLLSLC